MERFARFMQGRNGIDPFSFFLVMFSLGLSFVSLLIPAWNASLFRYVYLLPMGYGIYRMFSKKLTARQKELRFYNTWKHRIIKPFKTFGAWRKDRSTHKWLRCPCCRQRLRVPRGKGTLMVTCSRCSTKFKTKS
ncbi:MAG: hypothetical protein ACOX88_04060 [Christensenellales bacterium]|jgi:hypothetical protein